MIMEDTDMLIYEKLFDFLNQAWLGTILGFIGVLTAIVIYRISLEKAIPVYSEYSFPLIGQKKNLLPPAIEITFNKRIIQQLSKTYLTIWNSGKKTLYGKDIVDAAPITIKIRGCYQRGSQGSQT
jgi:hypothetical protein